MLFQRQFQIQQFIKIKSCDGKIKHNTHSLANSAVALLHVLPSDWCLLALVDAWLLSLMHNFPVMMLGDKNMMEEKRNLFVYSAEL
jgi:hypothetical protein